MRGEQHFWQQPSGAAVRDIVQYAEGVRASGDRQKMREAIARLRDLSTVAKSNAIAFMEDLAPEQGAERRATVWMALRSDQLAAVAIAEAGRLEEFVV